MKARLHDHDFYFKSDAPFEVGQKVTFLVRAVVQGVEAEMVDASGYGPLSQPVLGQTTTSFMPTSIERLS